jgi:DNA-binding transcriptional MerR regulator
MKQAIGDAPRKLFYRIQEVSKITGVKPHVLRYWETEFPQLSPQKGANDQRRYRPSDIELVQRIKKLLYEEKFTIAGARRQLEDEANGNKTAEIPVAIPAEPLRPPANGNGRPKIDRIARRLGRVREELAALQAFLSN